MNLDAIIERLCLLLGSPPGIYPKPAILEADKRLVYTICVPDLAEDLEFFEANTIIDA